MPKELSDTRERGYQINLIVVQGTKSPEQVLDGFVDTIDRLQKKAISVTEKNGAEVKPPINAETLRHDFTAKTEDLQRLFDISDNIQVIDEQDRATIFKAIGDSRLGQEVNRSNRELPTWLQTAIQPILNKNPFRIHSIGNNQATELFQPKKGNRFTNLVRKSVTKNPQQIEPIEGMKMKGAQDSSDRSRG